MNFLDLSMFNYLNSLAGKSVVWDQVFIFGADALGYLLLLILFLPLLFSLIKRVKNLEKDNVQGWMEVTRKQHMMLLHALGAAILAKFIFADSLKVLFARLRPFEALSSVNQLIFNVSGAAFPSGHASFFFALAMGAYFWRPRWSMLFFIGAALISISRVISGVHWPMDIIMGALLGIFSAWVLEIVIKKLQN